MVQMGTVDDHMKNRVHITQSYNAKITQCNNNDFFNGLLSCCGANYYCTAFFKDTLLLQGWEHRSFCNIL